ncbi:hypothetical protein RND81_14G165400 [Saponaria officinalis]|uniref:Uncharacterized protein n=1 Tax=Saponaria officinalis TaxID=3572 RepID=A0AAW1GQJ7_SAPOF
MLFKKSIKKTKNLFHKSLQNLKNFPYGGHDTLPRSLFLNPLSCTTFNPKTHHFKLDNNIAEIIHKNDTTLLEDEHKSCTTTLNQKLENNIAEIIPENDTFLLEDDHQNVMTNYSSCRYENEGAYILAQKMKELDMMEVEDVDHVLDVEEALNYYSRLSCPAYVDIVDKFFMDMYYDFLLPKPSINLSSSSRRLCPLKI